MQLHTLRELYVDPVLAATAQAAISQGLARIAPPTPKPWRPRQADPRAIAALTEKPQPYLKDEAPERDDPGSATTKQRYQDDFHYSINAQMGFCYEVAQFAVSRGEAGIVRTLWTWADIKLDIAEELQVAQGSGSVVGLDPLSWIRNNRSLTWHLRLWPANGHTVTPLRVGFAPARLPGYAYPKIPPWGDGRYAWGTPHSGVFIVVPSDMILRLFAQLPAGGPPHEAPFQFIGGRLQGYTQPIHAKCTIQNVRHGWNW